MLLSARAGEEASEEALRAGADDYVIKPFSARELLARVDARLTQAKLRAAERRAREVAERANRARDDFFATLSHELRTPLMAILGWTALLKRERLNEQDVGAIDLIERNARVQRRLIDDLLDMARIVTGRMRVELQPVPALAAIVRLVVDSFRPVAQEKGVNVYASLDANTGPVEGDPERLQQVVWNLLSNSIRFTPSGGRIDVRCRRVAEAVEVSVRDSGRGIRAEAVAHIFERYWQGQFDSHPGQGLGLGLAIAHRIVSLHSGTILAASEGEGRGATFTVRLPVSDCVAVPAQAGGAPSTRLLDAAAAAAVDGIPASVDTLDTLAPTPADAPPIPAVALRILLIDDHEATAKACQRLLVGYGHTVLRTGGLTGAVHALQESAAFDIVICDLGLPDGDGLELPARMLTCARADGTPIDAPPAIAISGRVFKDDVARCIGAGFKEHLAKPFDEAELTAAVRRVTSRSLREDVDEVLQTR